MKRFIYFIIVIAIFIIAAILGLKNQELVSINYLIAQSEIRLSTLLAILFVMGFIFASVIGLWISIKLKVKNGYLKRQNMKQKIELDKAKVLPKKD